VANISNVTKFILHSCDIKLKAIFEFIR